MTAALAHAVLPRAFSRQAFAFIVIADRAAALQEGNRRARFRPAFTLIELLVVSAIIAVLIGLLIPAGGEVNPADW